MKITRLDDGLSVSPQIGMNDIPAIVEAGFKAIVNNRPDGEEAHQPQNKNIAEAASQAGLAYYYQPVVSGSIQQQDVQTFASSLARAEKPVLAFCRTGTRCSILWLMNNLDQADKAFSTLREAGYDLDHLRPQLMPSSN